MRVIAVALIAFALAGCATPVAVKRTFPEAPASLMAPADKLTPLAPGKTELSDIIENANDNAGKYYQLREKYRAWQEWYKEQKQIFDEVN
jgi:PBP1b-binding outer membrane lipoprotein LpoB